jgi:hypothetical protein
MTARDDTGLVTLATDSRAGNVMSLLPVGGRWSEPTLVRTRHLVRACGRGGLPDRPISAEGGSRPSQRAQSEHWPLTSVYGRVWASAAGRLGDLLYAMGRSPVGRSCREGADQG